MPLGIFANPFALTVLTIAAIGIITYEILSNKKSVPTRGRARYKGIDYGKPEPDKPNKPPGGFDNWDDDDNGMDGGGNGACNETTLQESSNASSGVRKRTVAIQTADTSKTNNLKVNCSDSINQSHSDSNSIDENSDLASDSSINHERQYPSQQNSEMQKVKDNISEVNSNETFVANINDEDSDSSESNNSLQDHNKSMELDECIYRVAGLSTSGSNNIRTPAPIGSFEEIYKRDVCSHLKTHIDGKIYEEEKCVNDFSDEESVSENNFSAISEDSNASCTVTKKPELCKGCLEEFANAVAYPCKHCYLCLDCAVKVHRIFKKCSICYSVVKTFEQLKM